MDYCNILITMINSSYGAGKADFKGPNGKNFAQLRVFVAVFTQLID